MMPEATIVTSWDGSAHGSAEYVNRLFRACKRRTTIPFSFLLYTGPEAAIPGRLDGMDPAIGIVQTGLPWWWCGMPFWKEDAPGVKTERRLFLDLDTVIVGSLDDLILYDSDHVCSRDWPKDRAPMGEERDANPGVTMIRLGGGAWVWEEYERGGKPTWSPHDRSVDHSPFPLAAQGIINDRKRAGKGGTDLFPEPWAMSYKLAVQDRGIPEGCRIVHFHGKPKQWHVNEPFVRDNWR